MRILFYDIDTLRADHLGCYGYCRDTSPNMDRVAAEGMRFEHCYVSDAPCLPSRASLFTGRFGIHTGVVNHGGLAADLRLHGRERAFRHGPARNSWTAALRQAGLRPVSFSPFAERHSAWWFYHGWLEMHNTGKGGMEIAPEVVPAALRWLDQHATEDNWFLHVNVWDPHTPYRTPLEFGDPFKGKPFDEWLTEDQIKGHFASYGPHSAQDLAEAGPCDTARWPRIPAQIACLDDYVRWINGYDTGIRYADHHLGLILAELERQGVLADTAIIISSDHGENQGELNIYGDHHTADNITARVPFILRWPGLGAGRVDAALHYQTDLAATLIELLGGQVPPLWDGRSFAQALREKDTRSLFCEAPVGHCVEKTPGVFFPGRDTLVCGNCAWSCQRSVRWDNWLLLRTFHDGLKDLAPVLLFDIAADPHLTRDLSKTRPDLANDGLARLHEWTTEMMRTSESDVDPLWTVLREGGPFHTRGRLSAYCERLRQTGRAHHAEALLARHGHWMT
ncbi:MAG: sulfatase [Planctomycetes bacterium]|nr:sulfatase [Planctomycetota bacterium]